MSIGASWSFNVLGGGVSNSSGKGGNGTYSIGYTFNGIYEPIN